jgi:tetratricopeptide (TPR) repeat protein
VALQEQEAHRPAARAYQLYREADPNGAWVGVAWSNEATVWRRLGDDAKAEDYYRKAVAADPGRLTNHVNLAALLLMRQRWSEAAAAAEKGLTVEGEPPLRQSLHEIVATARVELRQGEPALKAAQAVLDVNPWRGRAHYLYGRALMLLNRPEEAMAALQQTLALEPDNADAAWLLRMVNSAAVNAGTAVAEL